MVSNGENREEKKIYKVRIGIILSSQMGTRYFIQDGLITLGEGLF